MIHEALLPPAAAEAPEVQAPMPWEILTDVVPPELLASGVGLALVAGTIAATVRRNLPSSARRQPVLRLGWRAQLRLHPGPGWAGDWERWRHLGLPAARQVAKTARPSLTWWDRHCPGAWGAYATKLGTGWGWIMPRRAFVDLETIILALAGPRRGKSSAAIDSILNYTGPLIASSIRDDLLNATIGPRSEMGRVEILNPEALGSYATTFGWSPIPGCSDPLTAARRAVTMVEAETGKGISDAQFWHDQAAMVFAGYLHAADLAGYGMDDLYEWCNGTDDTPLRILHQAAGANPASRGNIENFLKHMPERTKGSLVITLRGALKFMESPEVRRVVGGDMPQLDLAEFMRSGNNTMYLVSRGAESSTRPLFAALLDEIAFTSQTVAAQIGAEAKAAAEAEAAHTGRKPKKDKEKPSRLDPPLRMELDEIANIAPVRVDRWVSWMGGTGVQVRMYAQSWAQLHERYGDMAEALWACAGAILVYGGATEPELLQRIYDMAGKLDVRGPDTITYDHNGEKHRQKTTREVPLLNAADLRLPKHWAILLTASAQPMLVRTPNGHKRRAVKAWKGRRPGGFLAPVRVPAPAQNTALRDEIERSKALGEPEQQQEVAPAAEQTPARPWEAPGEPAAQRERQEAPPPLLDEIAERRRKRQEALIEESRRRRQEEREAREATTGAEPPTPGSGDQPGGESAGWSGPAPRLNPPAPQRPPRPTGGGAGTPAPPPPTGRATPAEQPPADPPPPVQGRMHPAPWLPPEQGGPRRKSWSLPEYEQADDGGMPWDEPWGSVDKLPPLDGKGDDEDGKK